MKERNTKSLWMMAAAIGGLVVILVIFVAVLTSSKKSTPRTTQTDPISGYSQQLTAAQANKLREGFQRQMREIQIESNHKIAALQKELTESKADQSAANKDDKASSALLTQIKGIREQMGSQVSLLKQRLEQLTQQKQAVGYDDLSVGDGKGQPSNNTGVTWVADNTVPTDSDQNGQSKGGFDLFGSASSLSFGHKKNNKDDEPINKEKEKPIPYYTIPPNSLMTDVIPLQPLIGRIPKANGNVFQPFSFMFMTEHPTLMAQGHEAPIPVAKMLGTAVCVGDFLSHSVSCQVKSLTFIFPDGHYQVINAKQDKNNGQNLANGIGTITNHFGNPQIVGDLKTAMGLRLAVSTGFGALTAYGEGLSQAQVQNFGGNAATVFQTINNANQYAVGQAVAGAAAGAQEEWNQIAKTIYDYVFVPNWNPETRKLIRLNITVSEPIEIDYDKNGRLINYEREVDENTHNLIL